MKPHHVTIIISLYALLTAALFYVFQDDQKETSDLSLNTKIYLIGMPSIGVIESFLPVTVSHDQNGASAVIESGSINTSRFSPPVFFLDDTGTPLPEPGRVETESSLSDSQTLLALSLPEAYREMKPKQAKILLSKNPNARRLPLSALMYDEDAIPYIWLFAFNGDDPSSGIITRHSITLDKKDKHFFDAGRTIKNRQMVILNPDDRLLDNQIIDIQSQDVNAPTMSTAIRARDIANLRGQLCEGAACLTGSQEGSSAGSCPSSANISYPGCPQTSE